MPESPSTHGEVQALVGHLRELIEERFAAHTREHLMIREMVSKAEDSVNTRLEGMNALRSQIERERSQYLSRVEYDAKHETLEQRVADAERTLAARLDGVERTLTERVIGIEKALVERIAASDKTITDRLTISDRATNERLNLLERGSANLSGRLWALGVGIGLLVVAVNVALKFMPGGG